MNVCMCIYTYVQMYTSVYALRPTVLQVGGKVLEISDSGTADLACKAPDPTCSQRLVAGPKS